MMQELCLVHLLRHGNDPRQFRQFIDSYHEHPAGCEHELLILYKGFEHDEQCDEYRSLLGDLPYREFSVTDEGFDITAYLTVAHELGDTYRYFCFTNSHSTILCDNWLEKLYHHIRRKNVGLVGTSGSWISHRGCISSLRLYVTANLFVLRLYFSRYTADKKKEYINRVRRHLKWLTRFDHFPNPHLRTNGFMVATETLNNIDWPPIKTKHDAYFFESGQDGLSAQIIRSGKKLLAVGCDGTALPPPLWPLGELFFQADQKKLMLSDNQTRQYQYSTHKMRQALRRVAWTKPRTQFVGTIWHSQINRDKYNAQDDLQRKRIRRIIQESSDRPPQIVLYGAGAINYQLSHWLRENTPQIMITASVDSHFESSPFTGEKVFHPTALLDRTLEWDYVLIASNRFHEQIREDLLKQGIPDERII